MSALQTNPLLAAPASSMLTGVYQQDSSSKQSAGTRDLFACITPHPSPINSRPLTLDTRPVISTRMKKKPRPQPADGKHSTTSPTIDRSDTIAVVDTI
jgi:hypothetical protein